MNLIFIKTSLNVRFLYRFVQEHRELAHLSEVFIRRMCGYFHTIFPEAMRDFENILVNEGLHGAHGRFGGTPFTAFAITKDYNCLPHNDPNDYGYGIIVWLHPSKFALSNISRTFLLYFIELLWLIYNCPNIQVNSYVFCITCCFKNLLLKKKNIL